MPMSPRLLRPKASSGGATDANARAYIAAVQTADGATLEPAVVKAIDDFVIGCKADGIWTAIKSSCILMGARTLAGALTPLAGTAPTNNNFVTGDYNRKTGLIGNASTKYLDASRNNTNDEQNDAHMSIYVSEQRTTGTHYIGFSASDLISLATSSAIRSRGVLASDTVTGTTSNNGPLGFAGLSRSASTAWAYRFSGATTTGPTTASSAPGSGNVFVFARNNSGPAGYVNARMAFYSLGSNLTLATLDTRVSALYTAIGASGI